MKTLFQSLVFIALAATASAEYRVIPISDFDGVENLFETQTVLECTAGTILPFGLSLQGEFLSLEEGAISTIKVLKTCYIKFLEDTMLFSADLQEWKSFEDFFTGNIQLVINSDDIMPALQLNLELNQKG